MFIGACFAHSQPWRLKMGSLSCGKSAVISAWILAGSWACTNLGTIQSLFFLMIFDEWQAGEISNEVKIITLAWSNLLMWLIHVESQWISDNLRVAESVGAALPLAKALKISSHCTNGVWAREIWASNSTKTSATKGTWGTTLRHGQLTLRVKKHMGLKCWCTRPGEAQQKQVGRSESSEVFFHP